MMTALLQLLNYPRVRREFAARVVARRRGTRAQLDQALAKLRDEPCQERANEAARIVADRLGFEEQVQRVAHLPPTRFVAEAKALA